ncbi:MAG: hypothetical protein ACYCQI_10795 [Gammaproteobacteria bacterium]
MQTKPKKTPIELHLRIAEEAAIYANRISHKSTSRDMLDKSRLDLYQDKTFQELEARFTQLRKNHRRRVEEKLGLSVYDDYKKPPDTYNTEAYQTWAKTWYASLIHHAKHMGIGNCQECVMLAMEYCLKYPGVPVEVFTIESSAAGKKKDHAFIVIGRDQSKNPHNIHEWGNAAVVCDPWSRKNKVYPATPENLKANLQYITQEYSSHKEGYYHTLENFNPERDTMRVVMSIDMIKEPPSLVEKKKPKS